MTIGCLAASIVASLSFLCDDQVAAVSEAETVVESYEAALARGDFDSLGALLSPDFRMELRNATQDGSPIVVDATELLTIISDPASVMNSPDYTRGRQPLFEETVERDEVQLHYLVWEKSTIDGKPKEIWVEEIVRVRRRPEPKISEIVSILFRPDGREDPMVEEELSLADHLERIFGAMTTGQLVLLALFAGTCAIGAFLACARRNRRVGR